MNTRAWAAFAADKPLGPFSFDRRALRPDDVQIDILYRGVCHSDLHTARNDWAGRSIPSFRVTAPRPTGPLSKERREMT